MHTDRDIVERIVRGDVRAFEQLVARYQGRGMALALRMLRNREAAEEALQDAFVRVYRSLASFEGRSSFSTWFYRILYNVCAAALAKKGHAITVELTDESLTDRSEEKLLVHFPDEEYEREEFLSLVREEIDNLSSLYASLLTLFYLNDMSYEEIVEVTGLPLGTIKIRLFRGRTLLRNAVLSRYAHSAGSGAFVGATDTERNPKR